MKAPFKAGDLVRSPLSKHIGIIVSVQTSIDPRRGLEEVFRCRVHWPHKGEMTETNSIWLALVGEADNGA